MIRLKWPRHLIVKPKLLLIGVVLAGVVLGNVLGNL